MATGIPSKNGTSTIQTVELSYPGKKSIPAILAETNTTCFDAVRHAASPNRLYCGDNLHALRELRKDVSVCGKVTLVYIDPPYATRGIFLSREQRKAYEDDLCGAEYVENLRHRLALLRELMAPSGSIYVHLDENMVFQIKLAMDEVFGATCYRNMIVRKKCNPKNYTRKTYGNVADFILFYTKTDTYIWNRPAEPLSDQATREYQYVDPETGRRFMKVPVHAPGNRNGATGKPWRGKLPPPGKHWQYTPATLDEMDARGEIYWSPSGNPRRKVYLDEHTGVGIQDIWLDFKDAHNQNIKISGYPTEKNPDLLRRIIQTSSNPGDMVLDCYAGSGTTLAVADEMQRHWIGVDRSPEAIATILDRCENGLVAMGDYVSEQRQQPVEKETQQLSLFASLENGETPSESPISKRHLKITEFSIHVEQDKRDIMLPSIEKWMTRNGLSEQECDTVALAVSESTDLTSVCYILSAHDEKLARIIDAAGPCNLRPNLAGFDFLVDAIISQQLSKKAADTIVGRWRQLFHGAHPTAKAFLKLPQQKVISVGISARKYEYISDLAQRIQSGLLDLSDHAKKSESSIRDDLKCVKGIGDWTVDMFLLFGLGRLDIFPSQDVALKKAMASVYGVDPNDTEALESIATKWKPYRSVGVWYMYRTANVPRDV